MEAWELVLLSPYHPLTGHKLPLSGSSSLVKVVPCGSSSEKQGGPTAPNMPSNWGMGMLFLKRESEGGPKYEGKTEGVSVSIY